MKQLFKKSNTLKTLVYFFENPYKEKHLREIARITRISPSTLSRCLAMLMKDGLIKRRKEKHATFFKATMSNLFRCLKTSYTISIIEERKIVEYILEKSSGLSSVLLYGSSARGEDDRSSDYDFIVIAGSSEVESGELESIMGREISIKKFNLAQWKDVSRTNRAFYLEAITKAIPLHGNIPIID